MCLSTVAPTLFLISEARFGRSTLQNYEGILRNQPLRHRLHLTWRCVLAFSLTLPLGLSVAYNVFIGGESSMAVDPMAITGETSYYGMFGPPGLQPIGGNTGISLFFNATIPFSVATPLPGYAGLMQGDRTTILPDLPLPAFPKPYGHNILLLGNESSAILDLPQSSYVSELQNHLAVGESFPLSANVSAIVSGCNRSRLDTPERYGAYYSSFCRNATNNTGALNYLSLFNGYSMGLLEWPGAGYQSHNFIGFYYAPVGIDAGVSCETLAPHAHLYNTERRQCQGTWSITRNGIQ